MHPPFSFRSCRKENGPCTVQKKRTPFVALRHLRASALYGGRREMVPADSRWLPDGRGGVRCGLECGFPRRECGRESGCKDAFDQLLFPRVPLRYALPDPMWWLSALAPVRDSQRQRKEKQLDATTTPTRPAPSATGRQYLPRRRVKRARRSGKIGAGTDTPTPVRTEGRCTGVRPSGLFFWTVHGPFSFPQDGKENGGCILAGQAPLAGARPPGRAPKTRPLPFIFPQTRTRTPSR